MTEVQGIPAKAVLQEELARDPRLRERWEETALARALAIWLVQQRAARGLSQKDLARMLGVSQPTVARWESGEHVPEIKTLLRLADVLGLQLHLDIRAPSGKTSTENTRDRGSDHRAG
ncbi:MAG: hypothetical protein KatS3mg059_0959 [Thermomicrobiales bacterium]|nr:MAG: hypothetical protein KatS3mg059_0959 [Thermomicrobiales bacterium]